MAIIIDEQSRLFTLHTNKTTYQMAVGPHGHLIHLYYGASMEGDAGYLIQYRDRGFSGNPYEAGSNRTYSLDTLPQEYPTQGTGDYRSVGLRIRNEDGTCSCDLRYKSHRVVPGKYSLDGLPAVYGSEVQADTLEIELADRVTGVTVVLQYGVLAETDVITRSVRVENHGQKAFTIEKVMSACLDFLDGQHDLYSFHGRHAMERLLQRTRLVHGVHTIGSRRGISSHQHNPFIILAQDKTTEEHGSCYGMSLVYSGSFKAEAELDQMDQTRLLMGIQDEMFSWPLEPGEKFQAPEVVMSYSGEGLTKLSQNYHDTYRHHLCRGKYKTEPRPVLINNWEATYFDFNGDKIVDIARQAAGLGVEMMVLDDGWFGKRDNDISGLGDWTVNEEKLGGSLENLVERVRALGMKFGIWMEPEMVSEDSDLYRAHPDWAFQIPGRQPVRSRHQLVLDFSRDEVVEHIYKQMCAVLDRAPIAYLKWDMNRSICDVYSASAAATGQGSVLHRYVLGVYRLLEGLLERYPELLIEGCSGGGGRFDAGMLYYTPQIWCSDNTDAIDRILIQEGTSFGYPVATVGAHISAVPNHQTGRKTPFETRAVVAMAGSFGYELDLNKISDDEKALVREQIQRFHRYWPVIHNGDYYRLTCSLDQTSFGAWQFVAKDKSEALVNIVAMDNHGNAPAAYVRLKGLDDQAEYKISGWDRSIKGSLLMGAGLPIPHITREYEAFQFHLTRVGESKI